MSESSRGPTKTAEIFSSEANDVLHLLREEITDLKLTLQLLSKVNHDGEIRQNISSVKEHILRIASQRTRSSLVQDLDMLDIDVFNASKQGDIERSILENEEKSELLKKDVEDRLNKVVQHLSDFTVAQETYQTMEEQLSNQVDTLKLIMNEKIFQSDFDERKATITAEIDDFNQKIADIDSQTAALRVELENNEEEVQESSLEYQKLTFLCDVMGKITGPD
ncbi:hypothetical protein PCE1_000199 [Barthelona sp. PCE]